MSRDKFHDLVNIEDVLNRFKEFSGLKKDGEVAQLFGIKLQNLSNQKKTGGLIPFFIKYGIQLNMNLNWVFSGKGNPRIEPTENQLDHLRQDLVKTINERLNQFSVGSSTTLKIRKSDPPEKKDELVKLRAV